MSSFLNDDLWCEYYDRPPKKWNEMNQMEDKEKSYFSPLFYVSY